MRKREILTPSPKSKFLKIKCSDCGNEQIIFSHASTLVKCNICNKELAMPTGGKAKILADKIKEILE
ncbi:MAG: 30S ribosomal protein S27e [Candidatus Methanomethyliaceae archaeon]|nr:30S ribosomal protein S27e [Candidatus Methanomethyliaceae archaeon]MDW7970445.1 30S ribosomal protein S27e [Nitrososphaerota archaeon]